MSGMSEHVQIVSCSTFHDPDFSLKEDLKSALPLIKSIFHKSTVCITPSSNEEIMDMLKENDIEIAVGPKMERLGTYKKSMELGRDLIKDEKKQRLFYVDFDRLVHWANFHPLELSNLKNKINKCDYLHVGRTGRAFATHPETQIKTERIVNELSSKVMGMKETVDVISVCYFLTKDLAAALITQTMITDMGFYGAWPVLLWNWSSEQKKAYIEAEGLEWETPDRFKRQIEKIGHEKWVQQFKTPSEWKFRVKLMHECMTELMNISNLTLKK